MNASLDAALFRLSETTMASGYASIEHVYLLGSIARWPRADRLLQSLLSVPVRNLDLRGVLPMPAATPTTADLDPGSGMAIAIGLALRDVTDDG